MEVSHTCKGYTAVGKWSSTWPCTSVLHAKPLDMKNKKKAKLCKLGTYCIVRACKPWTDPVSVPTVPQIYSSLELSSSLHTCQGLEAMKIEIMGLQEVNAITARGRGELLGDSMHWMPETCQSETVIGVHPPCWTIVLERLQVLQAKALGLQELKKEEKGEPKNIPCSI